MKKITIVFKSGAIVSFNAKKFSLSRSELHGITGFSWDCAGSKKWPLHINPENVDVVFTEEIEVSS